MPHGLIARRMFIRTDKLTLRATRRDVNRIRHYQFSGRTSPYAIGGDYLRLCLVLNGSASCFYPRCYPRSDFIGLSSRWETAELFLES